MANIKELLDAAVKNLNEQANLRQSELEKKIDASRNELKILISKKIEATEEKLKNLEVKVSDHMETEARLCNLIVNGLPYIDNESLTSIYSTLASKLGFESPPEARYFRFPGHDPKKRPIMIKFPTDFHKTAFFERYLSGGLALKCGDFPGFNGSKERVYIQHDLSPAQYQISKTASQMKKKQEIVQHKVTRGIVLVKIMPDTKFQSFATVSQLTEEVSKLRLNKKRPQRNPAPKKL